MIITFEIPVAPRTKKNHQQIINKRVGGKTIHKVIPSKQYREYEAKCEPYIPRLGIDYPVNVKALYYTDTRRRVDLINLHEALHDILVKYGCLTDDNSRIIVSTDGSRVLYDKDNPRTVVWIEEVEE